MNPSSILPSTRATVDQGRVRVGAGLKLRPTSAPTNVVDTGKVRVGAGLKLQRTSVVDAGRVKAGAGLKRR